jgi:hypothetical protein
VRWVVEGAILLSDDDDRSVHTWHPVGGRY